MICYIRRLTMKNVIDFIKNNPTQISVVLKALLAIIGVLVAMFMDLGVGANIVLVLQSVHSAISAAKEFLEKLFDINIDVDVDVEKIEE